MPRPLSFFIFCLLGTCTSPSLTAADCPPTTEGSAAFVVFDFTATAPNTADLNRVFKFARPPSKVDLAAKIDSLRCDVHDLTQLTGTLSATDLLAYLKLLSKQAGAPAELDVDKQTAPFIAALRRSITKPSTTAGSKPTGTENKPTQTAITAESDRWISSKGERLEIYVFFDQGASVPTVDIAEAARQTRLGTDLATLMKLVKQEFKLEAGRVILMRQEYVLTKQRATVTVTAKQLQTDKTTLTLTGTLISGPTEHWFLSADLPLTKAAQLKYDDTAHALVSTDVPTTFYVGVDWMLGDVVGSPRWAWQGVVLKGLLKVSKNPLDSYGLGLGFRTPDVTVLGLELDAFSPFVASIWTKEDSIGVGGTPRRNQRYGQNFRLGLSFNLDKALGWVGK